MILSPTVASKNYAITELSYNFLLAALNVLPHAIVKGTIGIFMHKKKN